MKKLFVFATLATIVGLLAFAGTTLFAAQPNLTTIDGEANIEIPYIPAGEMTLLGRLQDAPEGYALLITMAAAQGHGIFVGVRDNIIAEAISPQTAPSTLSGSWRPFSQNPVNVISITVQPTGGFRYLYIGSTRGTGNPGGLALQNVVVSIEIVPFAEHVQHWAHSLMPTLPSRLPESWQIEDTRPELPIPTIPPVPTTIPRLVTIEPITTIDDYLAAQTQMDELGREMGVLGGQMGDLGRQMGVLGSQMRIPGAQIAEIEAQMRQLGDDMQVLGDIMQGHGDIMQALGVEMAAFASSFPISADAANRILHEFIHTGATVRLWFSITPRLVIVDEQPMWRFEWSMGRQGITAQYVVLVCTSTGEATWETN